MLYRTTAFEKALIDSPTINEANASPGSPSVHDVTKHRLHPQQTLRDVEFLVGGHACTHASPLENSVTLMPARVPTMYIAG